MRRGPSAGRTNVFLGGVGKGCAVAMVTLLEMEHALRDQSEKEIKEKEITLAFPYSIFEAQ